MKEKGLAYKQEASYSPIHMPKNTSAGVLMSAALTTFCFAMIWHIWWLAAFGLLGAIVVFIKRCYTSDVDYYVQPDEIVELETAHNTPLQGGECMSTISAGLDTLNGAHGHVDAHDHEHHDTGGNTVFGFWLYLMTDCLLFASFFATYAVLFMNTAGGVSGKDIFELDFVAVETAALLLSSITFGFAMISATGRKRRLH